MSNSKIDLKIIQRDDKGRFTKGNHPARWKENRVKKCICEGCGNNFTRHLSEKGKFCSKKCYWIKKDCKKSINCRNCGKTFLKRNTANIYCSQKCYRITNFGENNPLWKKSLHVEKTCKFCKKKFKASYWSIKVKYCSISCSVYGRWKNKDWKEKNLKKIILGLVNRPTSLEKQMIAIIQKYNLPYKYVGDGSFLIGFKNPDFININGEKKLIEVGNVFHHQNNYIEKRKEHFAKYGWESFIFIKDELNEEKIVKVLTNG